MGNVTNPHKIICLLVNNAHFLHMLDYWDAIYMEKVIRFILSNVYQINIYDVKGKG